MDKISAALEASKSEPILKERFVLVEQIGRGGLSTVYKARDLVGVRAGVKDPFVAIKLMRGKQTEGQAWADQIALMYREARRLRDLVHPNILRIYDMDADGDKHFTVMEFLEGRTLSRLLAERGPRRLELHQVDHVLRQTGQALAFAHAHHLVHADLKPGNLFITESGLVKVLDFGLSYPLARQLSLDTEDTGAILNRFGALTPQYASPERLAGAEPAPSDDVFSLGIITYILLAGRHPFDGKPADKAMAEGLAPAPLSGITRHRWRVLLQALAFEDKKRIPDVKTFVDAFLLPPWWIRIVRGEFFPSGVASSSMPFLSEKQEAILEEATPSPRLMPMKPRKKRNRRKRRR